MVGLLRHVTKQEKNFSSDPTVKGKPLLMFSCLSLSSEKRILEVWSDAQREFLSPLSSAPAEEFPQSPGMSSWTILCGGLSGSCAMEWAFVGWSLHPLLISGGHVFALLPSVSSFTPLGACTCSFQPGRFTSSTLPAGRDPDGEQVACGFVSSGPSTTPVTPVSGDCLNKDCQCECQRGRRWAQRGRFTSVQGFASAWSWWRHPGRKRGGVREPVGGEPLSSLRGLVFTA